MSRLIVKNLPPYVTPERLKEHFLQSGGPGGTLTDVKVSHKRDGTSRRFGFVGFKSEDEAQSAQKWFDKTFIDSARISVSISEGAKDAPAPRPNKKRRTEDAEVEKAPRQAVAAPAAPDNALDAFLDVMKPKKGPTWANEEAPPTPSVPAEPQLAAEPAPAGELSDMDWLKRHMTKRVDEEEKVFEQSDDEGDGVQPMVVDAEQSRPEPSDSNIGTIKRTARLFVRNLAFSCTDEELSAVFSTYGDITQVHTPRDPATNLHTGIAYVTFRRPSDALAAYEALDRKPFQGRLLHILGAVDRTGKVVEGEGRKSLKDEMATKKKAAAGKDFNWSMLYMNSDAVASSIADRMKIQKSAILNPVSEAGDSNPAVKLALAETHIINETKTYFESQGVLLSSFGSRARSDTIILVKNIPYGTTEHQIRELFEPSGELSRVLVPPAGTMAVVEYERPGDAKKGFRAVAYKRLGSSIVYLEKGPLGMFDENVKPPTFTAKHPSSSILQDSAAGTHAVKIAEQIVSDKLVEGEAISVQGGSTLYVKNLSFATTQDRLQQVFAHLPSFVFARLQTKPDPAHPERRLSMGYGFLGFKDAEGAKKALGSLHGFVLDGHSLNVSFAGRGAESTAKDTSSSFASSKSRTTKMIVKNVPFEATKKDIRDLFSIHGQLKSVRVPKKFDSRSRGFAFLEFVSRHEAENAFEALKHTHLLGRHLVLQWAEEGEQDIEELRKKAGVGFGDGKALPFKKRKLVMGKDGEEDPEDLDV